MEVVFQLFGLWLAVILWRSLLHAMHCGCGLCLLLFVVLLCHIEGSDRRRLGVCYFFVSRCQISVWWRLKCHTICVAGGCMSVEIEIVEIGIVTEIRAIQGVLPNRTIWRSLSACVRGGGDSWMTYFLPRHLRWCDSGIHHHCPLLLHPCR